MNISNQRLFELVISIFLMVIIFSLINISLFIGSTQAAFSDQVSSSIARFVSGTWDNSNCTYSQGYWKEHPGAWPVDGITIGGITYTMVDALIVLDTPPRGDATYILAHQLIAGKLNIFYGAGSSALEETLAEADDWLVSHPLGSKPGNPEREVGISLADILEEFNTGEIGPGKCEEDDVDNISSIAEFFGIPPTGNEPSESFFSATPIGMLPELPGTPATGDPPEQRKSTPDSSESGPPSSPEATQPGESSQHPEPIQPAEPTQVILITPTPAPTMNPGDGLITTPGEGTVPTPTTAPNPDLSPTEPGLPEETPLPTPTTAPTAYSGPQGCTQPLESWAEEPGTWLLDEFNFAGDVYDREGAMEILQANSHGDATYILAKQYITAQLNIATPADPTAIIDFLDRVKIWLYTHPIGSGPKNPDRKEGLELAAILESYNLGLVGPGPCEIELPTATSTPTPTPTSTSIPPTEDMELPTLAPTFMPTATITTIAATPTEIAP